MTPQALRLRDLMHKLWTDHVIWTRQFIVSSFVGTPDAQFAAARLLANQDQIGAAIGQYYGAQIGRQLTALLREHINIASQIATAAKTGDGHTLETASQAWYANADQIARFLSQVNPSWDYNTVAPMMREHLRLTTAEMQARLKGDWATDIATFDQVLAQALHMADGFASGLVTQFRELQG